MKQEINIKVNFITFYKFYVTVDLVMDLGGRTEIFRALVGSHNYNLNDKTSDKDYKVFVAPTFDDLYHNKQFSKSYIGETVDLDVHDIRKVSSLWWKANVNFLEVLYSNEIIINPVLPITITSPLNEIFKYKKDIVKMNLPYLYNACIGMHLTKKKQIDKGTQSTQQLVDKYGYDTKQSLHALRILEFLKRFAKSDFEDFKYAIKYNNYDLHRNRLLGIKNGRFAKEEFLELVDEELKDVEDNYKHLYYKQEVDYEMLDLLNDIVKEIVKASLIRSDFR